MRRLAGLVLLTGLVVGAAACGGGGGGGRPDGEVAVPFATGGMVLRAPTLVEDHLLVEVQLGGTDNRTGAVVSLDPKTFAEQWRIQAPGEVRLVRTGDSLHAADDPPLVVRDSVLVGGQAPDGTGMLHLVALEDGKQAWQVPTGSGNGVPSAAGDDDRIVYRTNTPFGAPGVVVAVETKSGKEKWESDTDTIQDPVVVEDAAVHVTTDGNTIVSDLGDGDQRWRALRRSYLTAVEDGFVLVDRSGDLVGVQADDGSEQWRSSPVGTGCAVGSRVVEQTLLYVTRPCADADGAPAAGSSAASGGGEPMITLNVVDVEHDGTVTGGVELPGDLVDQLEVQDDLAAVVSVSNDADRRLTVVDFGAAEAKWDEPLPNERLIALDDDHVYLVDEDDHLVAADRDDGDVDWTDDQDAAFVVPVVADGTVYGAFGSGSQVVLRALDAGNGKDRWDDPPTLRETGLVSAAKDVLFVADADTVYRVE
jgi:outer membrane protein assembly factor BamB